MSNLTKPQQAMLARFTKGERIIVVNRHHADGGQYHWVREGEKESSGEVCRYRTFWNLMYQIYGYGQIPSVDRNKYFIN